jgi:hypothetical protein
MEPVLGTTSTQQIVAGAEQPSPTEELSEGQELAEEAFEATIVRLDRAAAELLFRKAGL